ncbi:34198_t:CDS:2, partial [Racocetra persica]
MFDRSIERKYENPVREKDVSLYGSLRTHLNNIDTSEYTWRDPEASMVLTYESKIVQELGKRQKRVFMEPRESMKCVLPNSVISKCSEFVENFRNLNVPRDMGDIIHNNLWKENEFELSKTAKRILNALSGVTQHLRLVHPADVIVPLLRASLKNLPNDYVLLKHVRVDLAERQSLASKAQRNIGVEWLGYVESSRINCSKTKKDDDYMKLWRETLDGVAGNIMYLNVLIKDAG